MSEIQQDVAYLASTVGARPAGTEEEQLAASYMNQHLSSLPGITSEIEEFSCMPRYELFHGICFGVAAFVSILACISPLFLLPAFLLTLICAVPVVFDALGKPILNRVANQGISQNVVARYVPQNSRNHRTRKIILMANIDSPLARPERSGVFGRVWSYVRMASVYAAIALPVIWLLRWLFASEASGAGLVFWQILSIAGLVLVAIPAILAVVHSQLPLPEGANSNASGVVTIMEVARQISAQEGGQIFAQDLEHVGEEALRAEGLVPEGAQISYEQNDEPEAGSAESIALAKAALASVTGEAIVDEANDGIIVIGDVAAHEHEAADADAAGETAPVASEPAAREVDSAERYGAAEAHEAEIAEVTESKDAQAAAPGDEATTDAVEAAATTATETPNVEDETPATEDDGIIIAPAASVSRETTDASVPDWFKSAQEKAKRSENKDADKPAKRSRYADALDAALGASSQYFARANEVIEGKAQAQLEKLSHGIKEIKAPEGLSRMLNARPTTTVQTKVPKLGVFDEEPTEEVPNAATSSNVESAITSEQPTAPASEQTLEAACGVDERSAFEDRFTVQERPSETPAAPAARVTAVERGGFGAGFGQTDEFDDELLAETSETAATYTPASDGVKADPQATIAMPTVDAHKQYEEAARRVHDEDALESADTGAPMEDERSARARALQWQPSRWISPAKRSSSDRVVVDAGSDIAEVGESFHDFSVIDSASAASTSAYEPAEGIQGSRAASLDVPTLSDLPIIDASQTKQSAPIAQAEERHYARPNTVDLSSQVPRVTTMMDPIVVDERASATTTPAVADNKRAALGTLLPSMSGTISEEGLFNTEPEPASTPVAGMTGSFAPVAETLETVEDDQDFSLDDVDESAFVNEFNEEAIAPGYVEMPESRIKKFFSRFSRKKKSDHIEASSPNEWLNVDEDFNPTRVGAERGGWDSFREDEYEGDYIEDSHAEDYLDDEYTDDLDQTQVIDPKEVRRSGDDWKGGAFSKVREQSAKLMSRREGEEAAAEDHESAPAMRQHPEPTEEAQRLQQAFDQVSSLLSAEEREQIAEETRLIYGLRGNTIDVEVWFVGLGADNCGHAGVQKFIETHKSELRGATFINIDGVGAGTFSVVKREGIFGKRTLPVRVTRILHKAVQLTGIPLEKKDQIGEVSAAYVAGHSGHQAFSLIGADESGVAYQGSAHDSAEVVDTAAVAERAGFIMRFIENI